MPESLMVIRSSSTLRKHWEWMTFSADSVSSVHTLTDDLPLESLAISPVPEMFIFDPTREAFISFPTLPNAKYNLTAKHYNGWQRRRYPTNTDWHWTVVDKQNESVEVIGIQSEKPAAILSVYILPDST